MKNLVCVVAAGVWIMCSSAAATPLPPAPAPLPVVVFQPGILGFAHLDGLGDYWGEVPARLRRLGFVVVERAPAPVSSPAVRGVELAHDIIAIAREHSENTGVDSVIVVAHSQGGVDVRHALALVPELRQHVGAVATVASPHHGSSMTDVADVFPDGLVDGVLAGIHWTFEKNQGVPARPAMAREALAGLSSTGMTAFNAAHPDPGVPFFSVGGVTGDDVDSACDGGVWGAPEVVDVVAPTALWNLWSQRLVVGEHSTDGVVPTASMRFGSFLGCVPADHGDWMGWVSHPLEEELVWSPTPFLVELVKALNDVNIHGERAMTAHLPALARYARASLPPTASHVAHVRKPGVSPVAPHDVARRAPPGSALPAK